MIATALAAATLAAAPVHPCRAPLPHGPLVPAPIVMHTSCGAFRLAPSGKVSRLPRHWLAKHGGGTGRRWGAHLAIRRSKPGRYVLLLHGRVVWRSTGVYPRDGGNVGFGPQEFAFASYRHGIYVTDLKGPERLVARGRGLYPYDFTSSGDLIVSGGRTIALVSPQGRTLRRFHYRLHNGFGFDERTNTLYFITPSGILARAHETRLELARPLQRVDGTIAVAAPTLLVFSGPHDVTVTTRDGTLVAKTTWRTRTLTSDSGVSVSPDGSAIAFRLSDVYRGAKSGRATIYVLRAGQMRAQPVYTHRLGPSGCAVGANLMWNGRYLLYNSADGDRAVINTRTGVVRDLTELAKALPHRYAVERASAAWAGDFRRSS